VLLPIENREFKLWIGVGKYDGYPNGFLCFIEPHSEYVRRLWPFWAKIATRERVVHLQAKIDDASKADGEVRNVKWSTHEQFNRGGA
jgi:hypothetical protein